jgi:hypothetical protein
MTLPGTPPTIDIGGIGLLTIAPAAITDPLPILTPSRITTWAAIQTLLSISTPPFPSKSYWI